MKYAEKFAEILTAKAASEQEVEKLINYVEHVKGWHTRPDEYIMQLRAISGVIRIYADMYPAGYLTKFAELDMQVCNLIQHAENAGETPASDGESPFALFLNAKQGTGAN